MAMEEMITQYVKDEYLEDDDDAPGMDDPLISSGIVDSFSMVSLKTFLENKYDIKIPDEKATPEAFDTVRKIIALVHEYRPEAT
jgi:acyl carrier protein